MSCHLHYRNQTLRRAALLAAGAGLLVLFVLLDLATGTSDLTVGRVAKALLAGPSAEGVDAHGALCRNVARAGRLGNSEHHR